VIALICFVHVSPAKAHIIILLGGYVAHATVSEAATQKRVISGLCYRGTWG
jgi:hypothetical protein